MEGHRIEELRGELAELLRIDGAGDVVPRDLFAAPAEARIEQPFVDQERAPERFAVPAQQGSIEIEEGQVHRRVGSARC